MHYLIMISFHTINDYTPLTILNPSAVVYDPTTNIGLRMSTFLETGIKQYIKLGLKT
jgi:hypothetical protein